MLFIINILRIFFLGMMVVFCQLNAMESDEKSNSMYVGGFKHKDFTPYEIKINTYKLDTLYDSEKLTDIEPFQLDEKIQNLMTVILENGYWVFVSGGAVRDHVLQKLPNDYDLITNCPPKGIEELLNGYDFFSPTLNLFVIPELNVDLIYTPLEIKEYLSERDYTINTLICLIDGTIYDLLNIREDFKIDHLKTIIPAEQFYMNNSSGILRAIRFHGTLKKLLDSDIKLIKKYSKNITALPLSVFLSNLEAIFLRGSALLNFGFIMEQDLLQYFVPSVYKHQFSEFSLYWNWQMNEIDNCPIDYDRYHVLAIFLIPGTLLPFFETYKGEKEKGVLIQNNIKPLIVQYANSYFNYCSHLNRFYPMQQNFLAPPIKAYSHSNTQTNAANTDNNGHWSEINKKSNNHNAY